MVFLIVVAVVGLALVPFVVLQQTNFVYFQISIRYGLVGALYISLCVLGIIAVFYPLRCKSMFRRSQNPLSRANSPSISIKISGHHPDCQNYSANRIKVGGRVVCAACSGLAIGAIPAFTGAVLYFFVGLDIAMSSIWLLVLGELWMLLGLAQIRFAGYFKVLLNVIFVVGSFLLLVEADLLGKSVLIDLFTLALIGFLLLLRILLSEWNNKRICETCQLCFQ